MNKKALADQKFRPLKKQMQQTFKRIKQAIRADSIPEKRDVDEFNCQVAIMVSYPGFGDEAYPEIVSASRILLEHSSKRDLNGMRQALAQILALQKRCHGDLG